MSDLSSIKVGDTVGIHGRYGVTSATVDRVTPTQIVVGRYRYNRKSGRRLGDTDRWYQHRIEPITAKQIATIRQRDLAENMRHVTWTNLTLAALEQVWAIAEAHDAT